MVVIARSALADGCVWRRRASLLAMVALVFALSAGSALATAPGRNGPIVFSVYGKIYTIQPDGSELRQVVRADEEHKYDFYPSWSPDGQRIATSGEMREPDGYWTLTGLQVFSADGSAFEHLPISGFVESPTWSPDGSRILFIRDRELLSTTPDGSQPVHIESNAWSPAWSPDGGQIAFVRPVGQEQETDLYTVSAAGGVAHKILDPPGEVMSPSWSPAGSTIVFVYSAREAREDPGPGELPYTYSGPNLYAIPATGGEPVQLTNSGTDKTPVWSPDGSTIAFQREEELFLMNADGSNERPLTTAIQCLQCGPDWASLPPHSGPPAPAPPTQGPAPLREQKFSRVSITRSRFARISHVWLFVQASIPEMVGITIRHADPSHHASFCGRKPTKCPQTGRGNRQVQEGLNRISLRGLFDSPPTPGRYWLQLKSSSGDASAGVAFRVVPLRRSRSSR